MAFVTRDPLESFRPRLFVMMFLVFAMFLVLGVRLFRIQIVRGTELASKGENNFTRKLKVPHDRGIIYDRLGASGGQPTIAGPVRRPCVFGRRSPRHCGAHRSARGDERARFGRSMESGAQVRRASRFRSLLLKRDLSPEQVEAVEAARGIFLLDGVELQQGRRRFYPHEDVGAHVLGYVNEITARELDRYEAPRQSALVPVRGQRGSPRCRAAVRVVSSRCGRLSGSCGRRKGKTAGRQLRRRTDW